MKRDLGEKLDILINNAGVMSLISLREGSNEELDRMLKINLNSHFYVGKYQSEITYGINVIHLPDYSHISAIHD